MPKHNEDKCTPNDFSPGSSGSTDAFTINAFVQRRDPVQQINSFALFNPPSCKFGPIGRPKNPSKPLEVQQQQQVFMNYPPVPCSKPWKEMFG